METIKLAQEFQRKFKAKYNYYPYSMKNVQEGKWWEHFKNFAKSSKLSDEQVNEFLNNLFDSWEGEEKLFPYVFSQEVSKKVEARILEKSKQEVKALTEDNYINMTLSKAALWAKRNNILNNKLRRFLLDNTCILKALRGEYYKPIFLFCSDFCDRCNDITEEDLLKKNSIRAFHPQLYEALKEVLREKFVD